MKKFPLLLTGTIDSSVYNNTGNKITNIEDRLNQYETSIRRYINETCFDPIVFIDNSGYDFDDNKFKKLAEKRNKKFEFIKGSICLNEILEKGKSFGDAFLIYEGIKKSNLLKDYDFFYKITGRIFLKNSNKIIKTRDIYRNEFICYRGIGWCLTNIFKANKEDYLRVLGDVYKDCDETKIKDIEISFYHRLKDADISIGSFKVFPWFDGKQGATLQNYSGGAIERLIRDLCAFFGIFNLSSFSSRLLLFVAKIKGIKSY